MTIALLKLLFIAPPGSTGGWIGGWLACAPKSSNEQPAAEGAQTAAATGERIPHVTPVVVALSPPASRGAFRWETETIGLYTLLIEAGLLDLTGVTVVTAGRPPSPGVRNPLGALVAEQWTAELRFPAEPDPDALELEIELCAKAGKSCRSTSTTASRDAPHLAAAELLGFAREVLDRQPAAGATDQWKQPVSQDPYAILIFGRAAAAWYGILREEPTDDPRGGIVFKAVNLDPSMALTQWLLAREYVEVGNWGKAMPHFAAAREGRPRSPVLLADEAVAMSQEHRELAAADQWDAVLDSIPHDPRFLLARVETALDARRLQKAKAMLDQLASTWEDDSGIAAARVRLADLSGEEQGVDELLAHWAETDPSAVEPVRRRIQLRIRQGKYQDAWDMLDILRERGAASIADSYQISLGVALGEWEVAASAAERSSQPDVAARIRARASLTRDPATPPDIANPSTDAWIVLGRIALARGDASTALTFAERADQARAWDPEVMKLMRDAYRALGSADRAAAAERRIRAAEPDPPAVFVSAR